MITDVIELPIAGGLNAKVNRCDLHLVESRKWRAFTGNTGIIYAITGRSIRMHRVIVGLQFPLIDHADGDGLNNTRMNLRVADSSLNAQNSRKMRGTFGRFKGVSWHKRMKKWESRIFVNGHLIHLGWYTDDSLGAIAYDEAARKYFGEFARVNFPQPGEHGCLI